jgi:hypothetical protein
MGAVWKILMRVGIWAWPGVRGALAWMGFASAVTDAEEQAGADKGTRALTRLALQALGVAVLLAAAVAWLWFRRKGK